MGQPGPPEDSVAGPLTSPRGGPEAGGRRGGWRWLALACAGLALAGAGEWVLRRGAVTWGLGGGLYALGIALFAIGAWPMAPSSDDAVGRRRFDALRLVAGGVIAALVSIAMLARLMKGNEGALTAGLWLASILLIVATGFLSGSATAFAPRWGVPALPSTTAGRVAYGAALVAILAIAALARFPNLDTVPIGINADEGDRAAVAIQVLRGTTDRSVFNVGWYHISMVFFKLLAGVLSVFGVSVGGGRMLSALCGFATLIVATVAFTRHFGRRTGLLAGALLSTLGPAVQFSRHLTEAAPTITLWTISGAFFLEAARSSRTWAWTLAGAAGGASIYFYPTGRLWPPLAAAFCILAFAFGKGVRARLAAGTAAAALAALIVMAPYFLRFYRNPDEFVVRARETTIFVKANPRRLAYYDPSWSTPKLVAVQVDRALGIFNRFGDGNFFWPIERPILPPPLSALTLLGLGAVVLRLRDPRFALVSAWFFFGFVGVIVTVETPNLQRMATTMPLLALFPALVLDQLARRLEGAFPGRRTAVIAGTAVGLAAAALMAREALYYFRDYARQDRWPYPTTEGLTVKREGRDAWVISLGNQHHMVNSGWVRFLAPDAYRGGVLSPGSFLPPPLPASRDLSFLVYPRQPGYSAFLQEVLPGGRLQEVRHAPDIFMFHLYRVPRDVWGRHQGAFFLAGGDEPIRVQGLGELPAGFTPSGGEVEWRGLLLSQRHWNHAFRIGPGPARLLVDGREVLNVPEVGATRETTVLLASGSHLVRLVARGKVQVEWSPPARLGAAAMPFERIPPPLLMPALEPQGLFGVVRSADRPEHHRLDRAVAFGSLSEELRQGGAFTAEWTGTLRAPSSGVYRMRLVATAPAELVLDGRPAVTSTGSDAEADVELAAGPHQVRLVYRPAGSPAWLEWLWTPPGGQASIVPPSALTPPAGLGVAPGLRQEALGDPERQPAAVPFLSVR